MHAQGRPQCVWAGAVRACRFSRPDWEVAMTNALRASVVTRFAFLVVAPCALAWPVAAPAQTAEKLIPLTVELGDVSLTKLPFIMAADNGIYERNGLQVSQFTTPSAAEAVRGSGVVVP